MGKEIFLPNGGRVDLEGPGSADILLRIAQNQVAIARLLQQITNQAEIGLRILVGHDSKNMWRARFRDADIAMQREADEAARLAREAAAGRDVDDVGVHSADEMAEARMEDEGGWIQEYESLSERTEREGTEGSGGGREAEEGFRTRWVQDEASLDGLADS